MLSSSSCRFLTAQLGCTAGSVQLSHGVPRWGCQEKAGRKVEDGGVNKERLAELEGENIA